MEQSVFYTKGEELANTLTHATGIIMGFFAAYILLSTSIHTNDNWAIGSICIYLFGMLSSYITSTCYHACTHSGRKEIWRKFDHAAIYLHIAGTYVPFTLVVLRSADLWGWSLFTFNWIAAISGLILSFKNLKKHSHFETICFVIMGCSILIAIKPLLTVLSDNEQIEVFYWLAAGGIAYIIGALFYSWTSKKFMHTIFHFFVLKGSVCHIIAIYLIF